MAKCIESALIGGEDVEIIVVDDGSTDGTAKIADDYAAKYPTIVTRKTADTVMRSVPGSRTPPENISRW